MNATDFFNEVVVFGIQILSDFNSVSGNSQSTRCSKMKKYFFRNYTIRLFCPLGDDQKTREQNLLRLDCA